MALETQISLVEQKPLGPLLEEHVDVVTTSSAKQIENPKESDSEVEENNNEVEKSSSDKRVDKNTSTPYEREVVKEVQEEAYIVIPPSYNPHIPFL